MKIALTEAAVQQLQAPTADGRQRLAWFRNKPGFGILISGSSDTRSYIVQHAINGKSRRVVIAKVGGAFTLKQATKQAEELLRQLKTGIDPKIEKRRQSEADAREEAEHKAKIEITLARTFEHFLATRSDLRPKSLIFYRKIFRHLEVWKSKPLAAITPQMIEQRHRDIVSEIQRSGTRYRGEYAANASIRLFRTLFNHADSKLSSDLAPLPKNPVRLRGQWFAEAAREAMIAEDQLPAFYLATEKLRNGAARDFILLLLFTGLRRGEASALKWKYLDFDKRVISIPASLTKNKKLFVLPMSDMVRFVLLRRRNETLVALQAVNITSIDAETFVFPGSGKSGHLDAVSPLRRIARATGIAVSPHGLRRTYAVVAAGTVGDDLVGRLLNHAPAGVTAKHYTHRLSFPDAAQKVSDRMRELCGAPAPTFHRKLAKS